MNEDETRKIVREGYAKIAKQKSSCCAPVASCCGGADRTQETGKKIGYTEEEMKGVPDGANLGLGCGNPVALASLKEGETVLDLGSGAGFDCFLASSRVGRGGRIIGVDMTPEMVEKARENARKGNYANVEFRLGEIENLPVGDNSVDAVISNCVINLSPNKKRVFEEAFRALRPGGRLMVSDITLLKELSEEIRSSVAAYVGCVAGAISKEEYLEAIEAAGFREAKVLSEATFPTELLADDPTARKVAKNLKLSRERAKDLANSVVSIKVSAIKPSVS